MSDISEPLTPPDCDLRGMPFMPVDIVRLFDSDLYALSTGEEFKAAFTLWGKAFLQVPAGSLPDDDRILAHLSGAGARWAKIKAMALKGWKKCTDGRLYHPVVAEKAAEAWEYRQKMKERARRGNEKRWGSHRKEDAETSGPAGGDQPENDAEISPSAIAQGSHKDRTRIAGAIPERLLVDRKGKLSNSKTSSLRSEAAACAAPGARPPDPMGDFRAAGVAALAALTGRTHGRCQALLGKLLSQAGDDSDAVMAAIADAEAMRPAEPVSWLMAALRKPARPAADAAPCCNDKPEAWYHLADRGPDGAPKTEARKWLGEDTLRPLVAGTYLDVAADQVREAANLRFDWRGDWETLCRWLREGYDLDEHIVPAIDRIAKRQGYAPPGCLAYFDQPVRQSRVEH